MRGSDPRLGVAPLRGPVPHPGDCAPLWLAVVLALALVAAGEAGGEPASQPANAQAGYLDAGWYHSCARLSNGAVRCWGQGINGKLGYDANVGNIGDTETPASVGPVNLGSGRTAVQVGAGEGRSCALMDNAQVRCWGSGAFGGLGYASTEDVGNGGATPNVAARGPVDFGAGTSVKQIAVGNEANCAILNNDTVKCWGQAGDGALGYGNESNIGDNETPADVGAVDLASSGADTAVAVSAGGAHTCAILTNGSVRCWGLNNTGQLGYGNTTTYGDDSGETPAAAGPVDLGGATAVAIAAGGSPSPSEYSHTCVILNTGQVKCWGSGFQGRLGYGNTTDIGDTETPAAVGVVDLGLGRTATAITAGVGHTCVILDTGGVRCWGFGFKGRTGHGAEDTIGDGPMEMPGAAVSLGAGRTAVAISAGAFHTCARLDDGSVICWGRGDDNNGSLGYGNATNIGDSEPASAGGPLALGDTGPAPPPPPPPPPVITPQTTITEQPKSKVKSKKKKVKVTYEFSSSVAGATFECSLDGAAAKPCTSPKTYKVSKGRHEFSVTATAAGIEDPSPASDSFKVKKKKKRRG